MASRYILESGGPSGYLLEDSSGVLLNEVNTDLSEEDYAPVGHPVGFTSIVLGTLLAASLFSARVAAQVANSDNDVLYSAPTTVFQSPSWGLTLPAVERALPAPWNWDNEDVISALTVVDEDYWIAPATSQLAYNIFNQWDDGNAILVTSVDEDYWIAPSTIPSWSVTQPVIGDDDLPTPVLGVLDEYISLSVVPLTPVYNAAALWSYDQPELPLLLIDENINLVLHTWKEVRATQPVIAEDDLPIIPVPVIEDSVYQAPIIWPSVISTLTQQTDYEIAVIPPDIIGDDEGYYSSTYTEKFNLPNPWIYDQQEVVTPSSSIVFQSVGYGLFFPPHLTNIPAPWNWDSGDFLLLAVFDEPAPTTYLGRTPPYIILLPGEWDEGNDLPTEVVPLTIDPDTGYQVPTPVSVPFARQPVWDDSALFVPLTIDDSYYHVYYTIVESFKYLSIVEDNDIPTAAIPIVDDTIGYTPASYTEKLNQPVIWENDEIVIPAAPIVDEDYFYSYQLLQHRIPALRVWDQDVVVIITSAVAAEDTDWRVPTRWKSWPVQQVINLEDLVVQNTISITATIQWESFGTAAPPPPAVIVRPVCEPGPSGLDSACDDPERSGIGNTAGSVREFQSDFET